MTKKEIKNYYKKWAGGRYSNEFAIGFTNMLMKKATWAFQTGNKININGKMRTGQEAEQIYCLAEDIFCECPELRGKDYQ